MINNQRITPPTHNHTEKYQYPNKNQGTSRRDNSIDTLKFLLICTVVFGHVIMTLGGNKIEIVIFNFIYSFHMPLFVFISGYFTHPGEMTERKFCEAFHFLSLFILFNLCTWLIIPRDMNFRTILTPQYAMWYLLAMFYWRFLSIFIKKEWLTWRNLCIVTVFSALVGFVPFIGEMGSFNRVACFLCFFMAGMMCHNTNFFLRVKRIPFWISIIPMIVIFVFMLYCNSYNEGLQNIYSNAYNGSLLRFGLRTIGMFMAVLIGIGFIRISQMRLPHLFAMLGRQSLFFYLYHILFIAILQHISNAMQFPHSFTISAFCSIIIIIACSLLSKIKILNNFLQVNIFNRIASQVFYICSNKL